MLDGQRGRGAACAALWTQPRAKEPRSKAISLREGAPGFANITAGARMLLTGHWLNHLLDFSFSQLNFLLCVYFDGMDIKSSVRYLYFRQLFAEKVIFFPFFFFF